MDEQEKTGNEENNKEAAAKAPLKKDKIMGLSREELLAQGHRACAGCGSVLVMRYALKASGKNVIICHATGCMEVVSSPYPETAWKVPWIHVAFENAAAVASGVSRALKTAGKDKETKVMAIGGDGGTFDIGLQALSGAVERGENICYICYDNAAYMNCLSLDSMIMTEKGLRKITDITVGEKVYAFDQKTHKLVLKKCTGVFDNGIKKVFELNTLHHSIKATSNHPFLTLKRNGKGKETTLEWKTLAELKKGDEVIVLKKVLEGKGHTFDKINFSKKGDYKVNKIHDIKLPKISSPELMEFLGLFVGDGWIRLKKAEVGFALPKNSTGRKRAKQIYKRVFGSAKNISDKEKNYIHIYSVNLAKFIDSLGFGSGAKNKTVPSWVFTLPDEEKEAFLKGLMLSDGYRFGNSFRYVSASQDLLKSLRLLLQTMNYQVGKIHLQTKKKGTFCVYRQLLEDSTYGYICFSKKKQADIEQYLSQIKQRDFFADNDFFSTEKITAINYVKEEPTLDLRVDGEHNFIADGIVVHNTGVQRSGATDKYAATTTTPAGKKIHGKVEYKKNMPFIIAGHGNCYVATANIAYPLDLVKKIKKGLERNGPAYIQVFSTCQPGWKHELNSAIAVSKLAFETNFYPLFEIEDGIVKISMKQPQRKPVEEFFKTQGRFKHLTKEEIDEHQKHIDETMAELEKMQECKVRINVG